MKPLKKISEELAKKAESTTGEKKKIENTIPDPYAGLSPAARDQKIKDDAKKEAAKSKNDARGEASAQIWRNTICKAEKIADQVEPIYHRKAQYLKNQGGAIMVALSDLHFGCVVEELEERDGPSKYNLDIARHRLAGLAEEVIFHGCTHRADELVIALTGDIFDSKVGKERLDKILNSEATACQSYLTGRDLIIQFIDHIREAEVFGSVRIAGISGNEARLYKDRGHSHIMASDNWDSLLNADLYGRYRGSDVNCQFGVNRLVVEVQGHRCLLVHGDQALDRYLTQKNIQSLLGIHRADWGISGHVHNTMVTTNWVRSASLVGNDYYSGDGLAFNGRAQQNIFWLAPGRRNTYVIDLQTVDAGIIPYELFDYGGSFGTSSSLS